MVFLAFLTHMDVHTALLHTAHFLSAEIALLKDQKLATVILSVAQLLRDILEHKHAMRNAADTMPAYQHNTAETD